MGERGTRRPGAARRGVGASTELTGNEAVERATGKSRDAWFALLDGEDATTRTHTEIARLLVEDFGVDAWWAQGLTVAYEQVRGIRLPGQRADGSFEVSVTRTLPGSEGRTEDEVLAALIAGLVARLGREPDAVSRGVKYPTARWRLDEGALTASASPTPSGRTQIGITRTGLATGGGLGDLKGEYREWLASIE
ncbi:hypothetical protein [Agromyces archimandritae]|uniref:DUF4287 domain-containing protein n=1 Tax=Agromyces archimandritae TaxID=2781962 RepID=A0A975IN24_9MICO|nr:hypothetical protein [Agromyces archimandritae]QTX04100.1 hypothetical protein G127AT_12475 [Agromyces archimandritae]